MARIFVTNALNDEATLIIGGVTISPNQDGVTVADPENITLIEVRPKDRTQLMRVLPLVPGTRFDNDVTYRACYADDGSQDVLLEPVAPDTIRFHEE